MPLFYLDSSALVKRYRSEKGSDVIDLIFEEKNSEDRLATSYLAVIEITGVAIRLRRSNAIDDATLAELFARFVEEQSQMLELFPIDQSVQLGATRIARNHGIRAADSIHLATAIELSEAAQTVGVRSILVVSDKTFRDAAVSEGVEVLNPEDDEALSKLQQLFR